MTQPALAVGIAPDRAKPEKWSGRFYVFLRVDAALPRAIHRLPIITIARSRGVPIHAVWINVTVEVALHRNPLRRDDERVPETAIRSVAAQFEPPTVSEGYVDVLCVQNADGNLTSNRPTHAR